MSLIVALFALFLSVAYTQNSTEIASCRCATPPGINLYATARNGTATSCSQLQKGVCCSASAEQLIAVQFSSFPNLPAACDTALVNLLCIATCFQNTAAFSTVTTAINATTGQIEYLVIWNNVTQATSDSIWSVCGSYAISLGITNITTFYQFLGGVSSPVPPSYAKGVPLVYWSITSNPNAISNTTIENGTLCATASNVTASPGTATPGNATPGSVTPFSATPGSASPGSASPAPWINIVPQIWIVPQPVYSPSNGASGLTALGCLLFTCLVTIFY